MKNVRKSLPYGVRESNGIFMKKNSDLFIDRDMRPCDLRMIANYIELKSGKPRFQLVPPSLRY